MVREATGSPERLRRLALGLRTQIAVLAEGFSITKSAVAEMFEEMARFRDCETGRIDEYRKRQYRSWGSQVKDRRVGGTVWVNEVCTGGCMALPAALFAVEVQADPSLQAEFGEKSFFSNSK